MTIQPIQIGFKLAGNRLGASQIQLQSKLAMLMNEDTPKIIRRFELDAEASIIAGEHAISTAKRAAIFGVDKETQLTASVTITAIQDKIYLEQARLDFSQPIHLKNIFTTLDELSVLVADMSPALFRPKVDIDVDEIIAKNEFLSKAKTYVETNAKSYLNKITDSIADTTAWKRLKDAAEKRNLKENFEKSKEKSKEFFEKSLEKAEESLDEAIEGVHLSTLELAKAPKSDNLIFFVSGEVAINEKLRHKFEHIQLPEMLLPAFDARLSHLLNQFCLDSDQGGNISRTILGMISQAAGHIKTDIQLFDIPLEICTRPGRILSCKVQSNRAIELNTEVEITQENGIFDLEVHGCFKDATHKPCGVRLSMQADTDAIIETGKSLSQTDWQCSLLGHGHDIRGQIEFEPSFALFPQAISLFAQDEALKMPMSLAFAPEQITMNGIVDFGVQAQTRTLHIHTFAVNAEVPLQMIPADPMVIGDAEINFHQLTSKLIVKAIRNSDGDIRIHANPCAEWNIHAKSAMTPVTELGLEASEAILDAAGTLSAELCLYIANGNDDIMAVEFNDSKLSLQCESLDMTWGRHQIHGAGIGAQLDIHNAALSISGLMKSIFTLQWAMQTSPEFNIDGRQAPLLPEELLRHQIGMSLSECGVLQFERGTGFYDHRFFNALMVPADNLGKLVDIISHEPLWQHLNRLAEITVYHKYPAAQDFAQKLTQWHAKCQEMGILSIKKIVHPPHLADALSILLFGDTSASAEILPSLERAHHAEGIDRFKIEEILVRAFPHANFDYAGRILHWVHRVFSTTSYTEPPITHRPALSDDPRYTDIITPLPTPNHIYDGDWQNDNIAERCRQYAAGFTPEQLAWILENHAADFDASTLEKLKMLIDIKKRFREMEPREGTFVVQDFNIDMFIDALMSREYELWEEVRAESPRDNDIRECFRTWLAPADIACLISAGIMSRDQGLFVQINQARLFEYLKCRGRTYARAAFYETGQQSMRVLAGMLMSWLAQPQNLMKTQVDRTAELSSLIGIDIPHPDAFAPLGEKQTASYCEAIFNAAKEIVETSDAYNAAVLRMQSYRFETTDAPATENTPKAGFDAPEFDEPAVRKLESALTDAIREAERIAQTEGMGDSDAGTAYEIDVPQNHIWIPAINAAQKLLDAYPRAYERPVLKQFWHRMYEALRIAAIDEDIVEANDDARGWFAYKLGKTSQEVAEMTRRERILAIIDLIYVHEDNREQRRRDPMTWTVPRAPRNPVNLTLVTAMGVITLGRSGHELETAFERLTERYGIRIVRSDTGMIKSLDYNADRIIEVLTQIDGPFVMFGYSQGCANMMRAESRLLGSTPEKRAILDRLVSRYALSSAFNGSVHAIASFDKYRDLIIAGELILKGLSTTVSKPFANLVINGIQRILDTPLLTTSLASVEALSHQGLNKLARDAQYKPGIVNLETQGIAIDPLPEMMINMQCYFDKQSGMPNDAQVGINCAHIYPVFNHNEAVDIVQTQTIPAQTLNYHHWAMLTQEIEFLETDLDVERFAYRMPRSFFVLPWIETLILFGMVK